MGCQNIFMSVVHCFAAARRIQKKVEMETWQNCNQIPFLGLWETEIA